MSTIRHTKHMSRSMANRPRFSVSVNLICKKILESLCISFPSSHFYFKSQFCCLAHCCLALACSSLRKSWSRHVSLILDISPLNHHYVASMPLKQATEVKLQTWKVFVLILLISLGTWEKMNLQPRLWFQQIFTCPGRSKNNSLSCIVWVWYDGSLATYVKLSMLNLLSCQF